MIVQKELSTEASQMKITSYNLAYMCKLCSLNKRPISQE